MRLAVLALSAVRRFAMPTIPTRICVYNNECYVTVVVGNAEIYRII